MMISKIADRHLSREACIYIRQSTMGQVRFNQESTERQYNLATKAQALGWSSERIRVLDRDLGQSGARTTFFFQAEDGIRDKLVTGVQTCALPISFSMSVLTFLPASAPETWVISSVTCSVP